MFYNNKAHRKLKLLLILSFFAPLSASSEVHVLASENEADTTSLRNLEGVQVDVIKPRKRLPAAHALDKAAIQCSIDSKKFHWDRLDEDLFFLHAQKDSVDRLSERYSQIPRSRLACIQEKLKEIN